MPGINCQWQQSATPGGPYVNVSGGTGSTTPVFTTPAITSSTYYVCEVTCTIGGASSLSTESAVIVNNPEVLQVVPDNRCGAGTVTLNAIESSGATLNWYDAASGGLLVGTGNSFTTPVISGTTNYWVSAIIGTCESPRTMVAATILPSTQITPVANMPVVCYGNSTEVSVASTNDPNYNYTWTSIPAGFTASGPGPHVVTPGTAGTTYQVYAFDASTQCGALSNILVNTTPNNLFATATSASSSVCSGQDVQLNVSAGISQNASNYMFTASNGSYTPLVGATPTSLATTAEFGASTAFNIGFSFNFAGTVYNTVQATPMGTLLFGSGKTGNVGNNLATTTATLRPGVAPLWDGLKCTSGVKYQVSGSVGNRVLTVEWTEMKWSPFAVNPVISFQVKLYESSNVIQFVYKQEGTAVNNGNASIGIMGVSSTDFISLQNSGAAPTISTSVSQNAIATKPVTGQIYTFTPPAAGILTYDWTGTNLSSNSITNPVAMSVQANEVFSVSVTDAVTGCSITDTINITALPVPVPSAFSNSPVCENADVLLFAFDGASYTWTGPDNYSSTGYMGDAYVFGAQLTNSGNYTVEVTGANGCSATETIAVQVNDNPEPFITSMNDISCTGFADGSVQVGVNGGTPFFSFNESSQGQNFTGFYNGLSAGTYYVEVTDINQCMSVAPVEVTINSVPNVAPVISCPANIVVNSTPGLCGAIVNYTTPAGSDVCPIISTSQTAGLPSGVTFPVGTTVNTFRVTDVEGLYTECSFSVTVTETEAPVITNCPQNFSTCNPVTWTPPVITDNCPGVQIVASHIPGNFPAGVTTVTYTATDVYNNTSTCSFNVTRLAESIAATSITSDRDFNNICQGEGINLTITGGTLGDQAMWKWYTGSCGGTALPAFNGLSTINVSPSVTTTYYARAEGQCNTTGCVSITVVVSTTAPGTISISSLPPFGAVGVTGTITCTPVPGATFYRWTSIQGHINAIWFPSIPGPVETAVPSVNVLFNLALQNYQIRVVAGNACGRSNNASAHIRGTVPTTTCLAGPALACPNTTATYSVATCQIPGTNGYQWTVGPNMTITSGQGTHTINVSFGAGFTNGQVCVNGVSQFGLAGPKTCLAISNNTTSPGPISGNNQPCQSGFETYTIVPVAGATSYVWSTNIAGAIANGNTISGTVQFPAGTFSGNVCVQAVSGCGMSTATCFSVSSGAAGNPGPILGSISGNCGATVNYALGTNDANSYNWIVPAGVSFASPNGSNSVQLTFPGTPGSHIITVEAFYNCGSATSTITVDGAPGAPTVTPPTICAGGDETYIASATGADSYNWSTTGAIYESCTNGNCSNFYVIWDVTGAGFTVEAVNACGTSPSFSLNQNCRISESGEKDTKVYPNPTTGQLTVEFTSEMGGMYNLTITDMSGKTIYNTDVNATSGMNQQRIDLESANPGMYMLYIRDGQGKISVTKVTKE